MRPERKFRMKRWISSTSNMTKLTRSGTTPFIHRQRKRTLERKLYFGLIPKGSPYSRECREARPIDTPGLNDLVASTGAGEQRVKMISSNVPLGRLGTPNE